MALKDVGATAAVLLALSTSLPAEQQTVAKLTVRIYNNAGILPDDMRLATLEAEHILRSAAISASWVECWYRDTESPRATEHCQESLGNNTLTLRLQAATSVATTKVVSMGYALVNLEDRAPFLATVYSDRVASVARSADVDPRLLLGRAIAHEIGHLLLNTNRHADAGLMREKWTRIELRKNDPMDWEFLDQEPVIMRAAVAARNAAVSAASQ
jgi:hypothetical protein